MILDHCPTYGAQREKPEPYPLRRTCAACGRLILVFADTQGRPGLFLDPEPGEGPYFNTILSEDGARITGSGEAIAEDCEGRFPLYRAHFFSCPERLVSDP